MGSYQISFFRCAGIGPEEGCDAPPLPGQRIAVDGGARGVVLVEPGPGGAVVASGSPLGVAGEPVTLGPRLRLTAAAAGGAALLLDPLVLAGVVVGLVGTGPAPGMAELVIDGVTAPSALREVAGPTGAALPPGQGARPRRMPFAFVTGTRVDTPDGLRPVEDLRPGDLVSTLGNGSQPLRWTGRRRVSRADMALREDLRPIALAPDSLGNAAPLLVAARHRLLLNDWRAQVYFGEDQVLVPALALLNGAGVRQVLPGAGVTYVHLMLDRHEILVTEGALSESFHPGEAGLRALDPAQRDGIAALFGAAELAQRRAAFPMLGMAEARALRLPG